MCTSNGRPAVVLLSVLLLSHSPSLLAVPGAAGPLTGAGLAVPSFDFSRGHDHSIVKYPIDLRKRNILRISHHSCSECLTLDEFYAGNRWGFILFFDRALQSSSKYKKTIIEGYMKACGDLRWSRVACGMVDMVEDKAYAEKYIDPRTAPAHIIVVDGQPIALGKQHVDALMKKPGDLPTIQWHLKDVLTPRLEGALDISLEVSSAEALTEILKRHSAVVVVGAVGDGTRREAIRAAAQGVVLEAEANGQLGAPEAGAQPAVTKGSGLRRWLRERQRVRLVFAIVTRHAALKALKIEDNTAVLFMNGEPLAGLPRVLPGDAKDATTSVAGFAEVLRGTIPVSAPEVEAVAGNSNKRGKGGDADTPQKAAPAKSASDVPPKATVAGRRASGKGSKKSVNAEL